MRELIEKLLERLESAKTASREELEEFRVRMLGKKGEMTELLKRLKEIPPEERRSIGQLLNEARGRIERAIDERSEALSAAEKEKRLKEEFVDITLPAKKREPGTMHVLNTVRQQILDCLLGLGFTVSDGPEIEDDFHNFQALNIPKDHPARDMQDTFYIGENILLRTHTSPTQIRTMLGQKPPIKVLCPGKVYRADDDATHSPMFHQVEGLVIDKGITLCDLKGVLNEFARRLFNKDVKIRLRPSYFPFTEPSVEVDVSCVFCGGKGCRLCKGSGWIEILGAGMVNRRVLENCGVDPDVYSGFAFGLGIERVAMLKYGIPDMRLLFENDVRFLKQFTRQEG